MIELSRKLSIQCLFLYSFQFFNESLNPQRILNSHSNMKKRERKFCNAHTHTHITATINSMHLDNKLPRVTFSLDMNWTALYNSRQLSFHRIYTLKLLQFSDAREEEGRKNCIFPIKHFPLISVLVIWDFPSTQCFELSRANFSN